MSLYKLSTENIEVRVIPMFSRDRSSVNDNVYMYLYAVQITNNSTRDFVLKRRLWKIRNGLKKESIVEGPGVVGLTPRVKISQTFSYTSFCPLTTPTGNMRGSFYILFDGDEKETKIDVPLFFFRQDEVFEDKVGNDLGPQVVQ